MSILEAERRMNAVRTHEAAAKIWESCQEKYNITVSINNQAWEHKQDQRPHVTYKRLINAQHMAFL